MTGSLKEAVSLIATGDQPTLFPEGNTNIVAWNDSRTERK